MTYKFHTCVLSAKSYLETVKFQIIFRFQNNIRLIASFLNGEKSILQIFLLYIYIYITV